MSRIAVLSPEVIDRIAAGEVIERPAAVLKELVENSLDAGASRIEIVLEGAGSELIQVSDDGRGMTPEEMKLALERHATSKISAFEDIYQVSTLGFRGEALPSIASVARLEMVSAPPEALGGHRLVMEGGRLVEESTVSRPPGTLIRVRDLYFNTPARRKFVRSPQTEWRHLLDTASRLALSRPEVGFSVYRRHKQVFLTPGRGQLEEAILHIWGRQVIANLVPVEYSRPEVQVEGYVSQPQLYRANRQQEVLFLNGRLVRDPMLSRALEEAYRRVWTTGRYPVAVLFLQVPPGEVDPNVHPGKLHVKLRQPDSLMAAVRQAVEQALSHAHSKGPLVARESLSVASSWDQGEAPSGQEDQSSGYQREGWAPGMSGSAENGWASTPRPRVRPQTESGSSGSEPPSWQEMAPLGQVYRAYVVASGPGGLFLLEQHAAHERILYEQLLSQLQKHMAPETQMLLMPRAVTLTPAQYDSWEAQRADMEKLGFNSDHIGDRDVLLQGAPSFIQPGQESDAFMEALQTLEGTGAGFLDQHAEKLALILACHGAIPSGQALGRTEMETLIRDLARCRQPATCPHGRPTILHLSLEELDRRLQRGQ